MTVVIVEGVEEAAQGQEEVALDQGEAVQEVDVVIGKTEDREVRIGRMAN